MKSLRLIPLLLLVAGCTAQVEESIFDIVNDFGAVGDGVTDCTDAINAAIEACSLSGSEAGVVLVPAGTYLSRTIMMKSNVELRLERDAVLLASDDPESYSSYIPVGDMSRYDSGDGTVNSNNSKDVRWNRAFILGVGVNNVSITGEGVVEGGHVFDPLGEESMRGPHAILFAESENLRFSGFTVSTASNYAFMGYALENVDFSSLYIKEGWDGIHIRGGVNVAIHDCRFETGDDAIAGGYWTNFNIHDCMLNSSCNGVRLIMPAENLAIRHCSFEGPGRYPHRTSGRTNMLFGISLEPGAWGTAEGELNNVVISDLNMTNVSSPFSVSVRDGSLARNLVINNVTATGVYGAVSPIVCWLDNGFDSITIGNFVVTR